MCLVSVNLVPMASPEIQVTQQAYDKLHISASFAVNGCSRLILPSHNSLQFSCQPNKMTSAQGVWRIRWRPACGNQQKEALVVDVEQALHVSDDQTGTMQALLSTSTVIEQHSISVATSFLQTIREKMQSLHLFSNQHN